MLIVPLFSWWYGQGWQLVIKNAELRLVRVAHIFSLPILIRTLFAPWRRIITYPGAGLDAQLRAFGDNLVSRCIGFTVRVLVLIAAGLILMLTACIGFVSIILWPLVPLAVPVCLIKGFVG
jgi:hypothetical protein